MRRELRERSNPRPPISEFAQRAPNRTDEGSSFQRRDAARIGTHAGAFDMRWVLLSSAVLGGLAAFVSSSRAGDFVSAVPNYNQGTFATVSGATYTTIASALGKPAPFVGVVSGFDGVLEQFNSRIECDD